MKIIYLFILMTGMFIPFLAVGAQEKILSFDVQMKVNEDATVDVTEKILYDFGPERRHGILREVPIRYNRDNNLYTLRMDNVSATNEAGKAYPFVQTSEDNYRRLKIGDANKTVAGRNIYIIKYRIKRAINYFEQHDELYWNVTGDQWPVVIEESSVSLILPGKVQSSEVKYQCYAGPRETKQSCQTKNIGAQRGQVEISFGHNVLSAQEGLTIVAGWPKGIVYQPTNEELQNEIALEEGMAKTTEIVEPLKIWQIAVALAMPIITLIGMFFIWRRWGKDPRGKETIVVQYDVPDDLTPLEVGTLIDEKADKKDISASIIYLAVKGFLRLRRTEDKILFFKNQDYVLEQLKTDQPVDSLPAAERMLYTALFKDAQKPLVEESKNRQVMAEIKLSDLKNKFYGDYQKTCKQAYKTLVLGRYFENNPFNVRAYFIVAAVLVGFSGIIWQALLGEIAFLGTIFSGIIILIFSFIMPQRTNKGVLAKEHLLGLKDYLNVAEADRIKFHNAPEKNPQLFEKFLPYAMVFGVEKQWAKQFENIYMQPPSWYSDPSMSSFNTALFVSNLNSFSSSANSALATTASSGGSGFSGGGGGGFGGGGGSSW